MIRFKRLYALGLVFGLAACDDGATNPGDDGPFDPTASAADLAIVQSAFESPVFESLAKSGGGFSQFQGAPALASVLVDAG